MQTNFVEAVYDQIQWTIEDSDSVMLKYNATDKDILNLCGGIPLPDISNIRVQIYPQYPAALVVTVNTDQYEVIRLIDFEVKLIDNHFMVVAETARGKHIGTNLFLNQREAAQTWKFRKLRTIARAPVIDEDNRETDWYGYVFWANMGYANREPEEYARWAEKMNRTEPSLNELMQTEDGRQIWELYGTTWVGEFFLAKGHACSRYLKMYLKRKGIDVNIEED